jgi:hypothetical protein
MIKVGSSRTRINDSRSTLLKGKRKRENPYPARLLRNRVIPRDPKAIIIVFKYGRKLNIRFVSSSTKLAKVTLLGIKVGGQN